MSASRATSRLSESRPSSRRATERCRQRRGRSIQACVRCCSARSDRPVLNAAIPWSLFTSASKEGGHHKVASSPGLTMDILAVSKVAYASSYFSWSPADRGRNERDGHARAPNRSERNSTWIGGRCGADRVYELEKLAHTSSPGLAAPRLHLATFLGGRLRI